MSDDAGNVQVTATGEIYKATLGTTLPTSVSGSLSSFTSGLVGYISDQGVTRSISTDTNTVKAFQNGAVIRKTQTSFEVTYAFEFLEFNPVTMELYHGDNTTVDPTSHHSALTADTLIHYTWVLDFIDGNARNRICIPDGQITERGDTAWVQGGATVMPVTLSAFPDDNGVFQFEYVDHDITVST